MPDPDILTDAVRPTGLRPALATAAKKKFRRWDLGIRLGVITAGGRTDGLNGQLEIGVRPTRVLNIHIGGGVWAPFPSSSPLAMRADMELAGAGFPPNEPIHLAHFPLWAGVDIDASRMLPDQRVLPWGGFDSLFVIDDPAGNGANSYRIGLRTKGGIDIKLSRSAALRVGVGGGFVGPFSFPGFADQTLAGNFDDGAGEPGNPGDLSAVEDPRYSGAPDDTMTDGDEVAQGSAFAVPELPVDLFIGLDLGVQIRF